jgi:hypothetical protein
MPDRSPGPGRVWCSRPDRDRCTHQFTALEDRLWPSSRSYNLVLIGPDQVAAFWHQWDYVVETAGAAAVTRDIAEGSHGVVLNEVFQPHDPAALSTRQLSRTEGKAPSADTAADSFQARSYQDLDSV